MSGPAPSLLGSNFDPPTKIRRGHVFSTGSNWLLLISLGLFRWYKSRRSSISPISDALRCILTSPSMHHIIRRLPRVNFTLERPRRTSESMKKRVDPKSESLYIHECHPIGRLRSSTKRFCVNPASNLGPGSSLDVIGVCVYTLPAFGNPDVNCLDEAIKTLEGTQNCLRARYRGVKVFLNSTLNWRV